MTLGTELLAKGAQVWGFHDGWWRGTISAVGPKADWPIPTYDVDWEQGAPPLLLFTYHFRHQLFTDEERVTLGLLA